MRLVERQEWSPLKKALNSRKLDGVIVFLVFIDVVLITLLTLIEFNVLCLDGSVVPLLPQEVAYLVGNHSPSVGPPASLMQGMPLERRQKSSMAGLSTHLPRTKAFKRPPEMMAALHREVVVDAGGSSGVATSMASLASVGFTNNDDWHASFIEDAGGARDVETSQGGAAQATEATEEAEATETRPRTPPTEALVCDTRFGERAQAMFFWIHLSNVAILTFFMTELCLKICVDAKFFFSSWFHVLDLIVVSAALFMDTFMYRYFGDTVAVLAWIRVWRVVRILHGLLELYDSEVDARYQIHAEAREEVRHKVVASG